MTEYVTEAELASYAGVKTSFEANQSACEGGKYFQTQLTQLQLALVLYYNTCEEKPQANEETEGSYLVKLE